MVFRTNATGMTMPNCTWLATTTTTSIFSRTRRPSAPNQDIENSWRISRAKRSSTCKATSEPTRSGLHAAGPSRHWPRPGPRGPHLPTHAARRARGADVNSASRGGTTPRRLRSSIHWIGVPAGSLISPSKAVVASAQTGRHHPRDDHPRS